MSEESSYAEVGEGSDTACAHLTVAPERRIRFRFQGKIKCYDIIDLYESLEKKAEKKTQDGDVLDTRRWEKLAAAYEALKKKTAVTTVSSGTVVPEYGWHKLSGKEKEAKLKQVAEMLASDFSHPLLGELLKQQLT